MAYHDLEGVLRISGRICIWELVVRLDWSWMGLLFKVLYSSRISIYHELKQHYWCYGIKKDIIDFMDKFLNYQQVKYGY